MAQHGRWQAPIGSDPNAAGSDGRTALHRACFQGHQEVAQLLLEKGSDPRLKALRKVILISFYRELYDKLTCYSINI